MRRSQSSSEHAEAVSRRLASLSAELAAVRGDPDPSTHTRVREAVDAAPPPVVLPVPGRHASRRLLVGGLRLGPVHLAVVAVVSALAVGLAAWWAVRDQADAVPVTSTSPAPTPLVSVSPSVEASDHTSGEASGDQAGDSTGELVVDVAGKVVRPGIAVLPAGARGVDALEAAGGARRGGDPSSRKLPPPAV